MATRSAPLLSTRVRLGLAAMGLLAGGLLVLAANLEPSPLGFGTHQQLGLGPCWIYETTGIRCPSCGMTTAWAHLAHGAPRRAFQTHVGGALSALAAIGATPWLLLAAWMGRWPGVCPPSHWLLIGISVWLGIVLIDWGSRLLLR